MRSTLFWVHRKWKSLWRELRGMREGILMYVREMGC